MSKFYSLFGMTVLLVLLTGCSRSAATDEAPRPEEQNRKVVLAFYEEGLAGRNPRAAFERYMTPDFIEHKSDIAGGTREATIAFLEGLIKEVPNPTWTVVRTVAEGDMVFLHASFTPVDGAPPYAIADVFRLRDGKIVEHWDVVAPPVKRSLNPNSRF